MLALKPTLGRRPGDYLSNTKPIISLSIIHSEILAE